MPTITKIQGNGYIGFKVVNEEKVPTLGGKKCKGSGERDNSKNEVYLLKILNKLNEKEDN